jgi:hypothetical protein
VTLALFDVDGTLLLTRPRMKRLGSFARLLELVA